MNESNVGGDPQYLKLLEDMARLHRAKNAGYSGDSQDRWANFRMSESFGVSAVLGCLIRMSDKFIRIQNLIKNPNNEQVGEAITDTLMDLASYALITICLIDEPKLTEIYIPKIGDKVIPIDKNNSWGEPSVAWFRHGGEKQGFLYVKPPSEHTPDGYLLLGVGLHDAIGGDYFLPSNVKPYV